MIVFWSYGNKSMLKNDLAIKDSIGGGSMGDVYELEDKILVLKILEYIAKIVIF